MNSTEAKIKLSCKNTASELQPSQAKIKLSFPLARRRQRRRATSSLARRLARHVLVRPFLQRAARF